MLFIEGGIVQAMLLFQPIYAVTYVGIVQVMMISQQIYDVIYPRNIQEMLIWI